MAREKKRSAGTSDEFSVELDAKKSVTVRQYNGVSLVDIREFYVDKATNERKPGKKGIALTEEAWNKLISLREEVGDALDALNGRKKQKTAESGAETGGNSPASVKKGKEDAANEVSDQPETVPALKSEDL